MTWFLILLVIVLGAAVGSFVNVLVDRSIAGKDWISGRSVCDYCHRQLSWYDNIPLLSFVVYGGKSRCCKKRLSWKHPLVEGMFGVLFVWWLLVGFLFFKLASAPWSVIQPGYWLVTGILLLIIAIADYFYGVILMPIVYLGTGITLIYRLGVYQAVDWGLMLVAGVLSYLFLWILRVITKGKGMGDGDPYLAFWTGLILAWPRAVTGMLLAFIVGALWGSVLLLMKKKGWKQSVPFGPFLVIGVIGALLLTHFGLPWLFRSE